MSHMYSYQFQRIFEDAVTGSVVGQEVISTARGEDVQMNDLLENMENFLNACGYQLNGSGVGLISES